MIWGAEFSSVGRAFDCSSLLKSNCHLFDSGNSEKDFYNKNNLNTFIILYKMNWSILYLFLFGPFRNTDSNFLCNIIIDDIKQHNEIITASVKNTTAYVKNVIGNKMEEDTIKEIKRLHNQLEIIRKNLDK